MRHRLVRGLVPVLAATLRANGLALYQTLDRPSDLPGAYASIAKQDRAGDPGAQSRLLALGLLRLKTLLRFPGPQLRAGKASKVRLKGTRGDVRARRGYST